MLRRVLESGELLKCQRGTPARKVSSENGGSSLALMSSSKNADAAYKFMEFASTNSDAIMSRVDKVVFLLI